MQIRHVVAAAALAAVSAPSLAVTMADIVFDPSGTGSFSNVAIGVFDDIYNFTIGPNNGAAASATNISLSSTGFISNLAGTLAGTPLVASSQNIGPTTVQVLSGFTGPLAPGQYQLTISGNAGAGAGYGGSLVTLVPEPASLALLMAGLGVVGFVASRRQKR